MAKFAVIEPWINLLRNARERCRFLVHTARGLLTSEKCIRALRLELYLHMKRLTNLAWSDLVQKTVNAKKVFV